MLNRGKLPLIEEFKFDKVIIGEWIDACLNFWSKSQRRNGSFDEYYPYESGSSPTAFSLYSTALVCQNRKFDNSILLSMERAAEFILRKPELQALNQEIVGLTACSIVKSLGERLMIINLARDGITCFCLKILKGGSMNMMVLTLDIYLYPVMRCLTISKLKMMKGLFKLLQSY